MNMDYCYNPIYSIIIFIYNQSQLSHCSGLAGLLYIYYIYTIRYDTIRYNTIAYIRLTIDRSPSLLPIR